MGMTIDNLCNSCTNSGCEFQSGIVRTKCAFYMPQHTDSVKQKLLDSLAEEPTMVISTAYAYAKNYVNYGLDITKAWTTAVQQASILERVRQEAWIEAYDSFKKEYENRLKEDMTAMLTEIQVGIGEHINPSNHTDSYEDGWSEGAEWCIDYIQEIISAWHNLARRIRMELIVDLDGGIHEVFTKKEVEEKLLTELQLEIKEQFNDRPFSYNHHQRTEFYRDVNQIIQQKINKLKGKEDEDDD